MQQQITNKVGSKWSTKKIVLLTILSIIIIAIIVVGILAYQILKPVEINEQKGIILTNEELPGYLENHQLIQALPDESNIQLTIGENEYIIEDGEVTPISEENLAEVETDISIEIKEDAASKIGELGLCGAAGELAETGSVEIETNLSEKDLAWKYRDLLKYRECITG